MIKIQHCYELSKESRKIIESSYSGLDIQQIKLAYKQPLKELA